MPRAPPPDLLPWAPSLPRTTSACRSPQPTSSVPAWPEPWSPTAAVFTYPPCATSWRDGSSPSPPRRCSPACSTCSSVRFPERFPACLEGRPPRRTPFFLRLARALGFNPHTRLLHFRYHT